MRKKGFSIVLFVCLLLGTFQSKQTCHAEESTTYYQIGSSTTIKTLDEVMKLFEDSSPDIEQIKLKYDSKMYNYEEANDLVDDYQELYVINMEGSDSDTLDAIREEYLSALLNREILSFYTKNKSELILSDVRKQKYDFINKYYQLMVLEKQERYYTVNAEYLSVCKSIANIQYKYGRCTALDVSQISVQIEENEFTLYENEAVQEKLVSELEDTLGKTFDFTVKIPLHTAVTKYVLSDTIHLINENEYSYEEALSYRDAYNVCNTCEKAVDGSLTYRKNSVLMQQYSLQAEAIKKNITSYAKSTISTYKKYCKKLTVASRKLINCKTSYNNLCQKYKKGKAAKVDVLEADVKRAEAELNYYSVLSDKVLCEYVLEFGLFF